MTETETEEKTYPGKLVYNTNVGKNMHIVAQYRTFFGRKEGVYSDAYDSFVKTLAKRIRNDMQNTILIEGETGSGKSALALNLCLDLSRELKVGFDLAKDYIYSANDLWAKLTDIDSNPINLLDEGTVTLASNNAMQKSDKQIATLFDTMRSRHMTTFIVSPNSLRVNSSVRLDHADFKLRCSSKTHLLIAGYGRGFFEVRRAERKEFAKEEPRWPMMYAGIFGDYPPMLKDEYLHIKESRQNELMQKYINRAKADEAKADKEFEKLCPTEDKRGVW